MLTAIMLDGFRCFAQPTRVTLGALTVLAGANSAGKSSAIHALLTLVQSEEQATDPGNIRLSGEWVDLGSFRQVLNYSKQGQPRRFSIGVSGQVNDKDTDLVLTLTDPAESSRGAAKVDRIDGYFDEREWHFEPVSAEYGFGYWMYARADSSAQWTEVGLTNQHFPWTVPLAPAHEEDWGATRTVPYDPASTLYLSAFRDLPRKLYPPRRSDLGPHLGAMGEYVAQTLFDARNLETDILPDAGPRRLLGAALEAWWAHIFGGDYGIRAEAAEDLGFTLSLDTPSAENLRLTQVGTGLSQALPVIVLALCSKPGDLVIIESPEVQLHPAAQHRLMDLFVALVRAGRQVILETHSDHVVHAAQLAVKHQKLSPDEVAMRFFSQEEGVARVEPVPIDAQGRMAKQPIGFVDQASADLLELIR